MSTMGIDHLIRKRGQLVETFNQHVAALESDDPTIAPKILGVVPMMWKSKKGSQRIYGNATVEAELSDMVGELSRKEEDAVIFEGIRLSEKLFSENEFIARS